MGKNLKSAMASPARLCVLAVMCTMLSCSVAEQVEVHELAETYLRGPSKDPEGFQAVPGDPAGSVVYDKIEGSSLDECNGSCNIAATCIAFKYDDSFKSCHLLKLDPLKLAISTDAVMKSQAVVTEKKAEADADKIVNKQETEKQVEKQAEAKIASEPVAELTKKVSPRDVWRKAVRGNAKLQSQLQTARLKADEAKHKVSGTATVERVVKRHLKDITVELADRHKAFYASTLNMEEQMMGRPNPEAKEVLLAKGAREAAKLKYDKVQKEHREASKMEKKAVSMTTKATDYAVKSTMDHVTRRLAAEKSAKSLKKATGKYQAEEVKQKNAADLKKKMDASQAKTFVKMRTEREERVARTKATLSGATTAQMKDAKILKECLSEQERVKQIETRLKMQLKEEVGNQVRAAGEKQVAAIRAKETLVMMKKNLAEKKKLVDKAKGKVQALVEEMMQTMSSQELLATHERLLGEAKDQTAQAVKAKAEKATAALKIKAMQAKTALKALKASKATTAAAMTQVSKTAKKLNGAKSSEKQALQIQILTDKAEFQKAALAEKKARAVAESQKQAAFQSQKKVDEVDAESHDAQVQKSLTKVLQQKELVKAEQQADVQAAAAKNDMLNKVHLQAKDIRATEQRTVEAKIEQAWRKKKTQLNLKIINCANPHADENPAGDAQLALAKLEEKKALEDLKPKVQPPGDPINPILKNEIEANMKRTEKAKMEEKLSEYKQQVKKKMDKQLTKEKKLLSKEKKEMEATVDSAQLKLVNTKIAAALKTKKKPKTNDEQTK